MSLDFADALFAAPQPVVTVVTAVVRGEIHRETSARETFTECLALTASADKTAGMLIRADDVFGAWLVPPSVTRRASRRYVASQNTFRHEDTYQASLARAASIIATWRHQMCRQDVASRPHAASQRHLASPDVASGCGITPPCGVTKTLGVTRCGVRMWHHTPMRRHKDTWRHQMWRQDVASHPHAASQRHLASPDVASGCGVTTPRGVTKTLGVTRCGVRTWRHNPARCHKDTWRHQHMASARGVTTPRCGQENAWRHQLWRRRVASLAPCALKLVPPPGVTSKGKKRFHRKKCHYSTVSKRGVKSLHGAYMASRVVNDVAS